MSLRATDPVIYELNTAAWLHDIGTRVGAPITLADVPDEEWDRVTPAGIDAVWLMGVWDRSPEGVRLALESPSHVEEFRATLDDYEGADVIGSAYCIRNYEVDASYGGRDGLATARQALATRGVRLIVDFVPNHVAPDHAWLSAHPDYFVRGDVEDLARAPDEFLAVGDNVIARGRDPYFPPWPDVAQLNAFSPGLRRATIDTLVEIGRLADGVRCDMAMLMLNDVFQRTWGERAGQVPHSEYWTDVISAARTVHPDMLFAAEAYWDLEWQLQQLGFDYCYDKRLYDRLLHEPASAVRSHLNADLDDQRHLLHFTENHDEPRATSQFGPAAVRAAAVTIATLPGATLWHEGQFEGWHTHVPVLLRRRPAEADDAELRGFHLRLIEAARVLRHGDWQLCDVTGWPDDHSCDQLLTWTWTADDRRSLIVVNDSDNPANALVRLPWTDLAGRAWHLEDMLNGDSYHRDGDDMERSGLFVSLPPRGFHVFRWTPTEPGS